jgi:lysophospholipase L1-like esterase
VLTLAATLLLAEVGLERFARVPDPYQSIKAPTPENRYIRSAFRPHTDLWTTAEPGLPGMSGRHHFTSNNLGFRGDSLAIPKPPAERRVFVIGGSVVECFYLDDADALTAALQRDLQGRAPAGTMVRVYGAGKSGDRSDDHVSMLVHRIVHLEPDAIVLLAGVNDLTASIEGYDYLHLHVYSRPPPRLGMLALLRLAATGFQIPRRLYFLFRLLRPPAEEELQEEIPLLSNYRQLAQKRQAAPRSDRPPATNEPAFARNLRTIAGVARAHKIRLAFVTQPSTWNSTVDPAIGDWQWMLLRKGVAYRPDLMDQALERLNQVTRDVGAAEGVPVYDLAKAIPKSGQFFYDDVHLNVNGARAAADGVARFLETHGVTR